MSLTLPIAVGKRYVRRDGQVIRTETGGHGTAIVGRLEAVFCTTGRANHDYGPASEQDLIADAVDQGHPHAALMLQYAQDAAETAKPWRPMTGHPGWIFGTQYRRKPRTIRIGQFDVPEPLRKAPINGVRVYFISLSSGEHALVVVVHGPVAMDDYDQRMLARGLVHLTRDAAELHARALLSFTEQK